MAKHRFGPGNKFGKGGAKPGAGRTPEWLAQKCQKIIEKHKLIDFLGELASGKYTEVVIVNDKKTKMRRSASGEVRLKALAMLTDRGFGKAPENLTVAGVLNLHVTVAHYD